MTGVGTLLRFHLRRDRWMLGWWALGLVLLYWTQAVSIDGLYPSQAEFARAARAMESNPAFIAMAGPPRALDTVGGQVAWQCMAFGAVMLGLLAMFLAGRHLRTEEESGRDELLRSAPIGRHAPLAAAGLEIALVAVGTAGLVALSLLLYGLPVAGSVSIAVALALTGMVFGAVALVAMQFTSAARSAYGIVGAVLGASYALRAIGDVGDGTLSWLSPIGWGQAMRPYSGERWWPAVLPIVATVLLVVVAAWTFDRRDIGAGLWPARRGPARASASLGGPVGLAWRMQRGSVAGWSAGLVLMGAAYGSLGDDVDDLLGDSTEAQDVFGQGGGSLIDSFHATSGLMLALIGAGFAVSSVLRLRSQESDGHVELLLSTGLSRTRWALGGLVVTVAGTVVVAASAALGLAVTYAAVAGDAARVPELLLAVLPHVAGTSMVVAVTVLAFGLASRAASVGWLVLGWGVVVMFFGPLLRLPEWVEAVSPFSHLALVPAEPFAVSPFVVLLAGATAVGAAGLVALRRRDIG